MADIPNHYQTLRISNYKTATLEQIKSNYEKIKERNNAILKNPQKEMDTMTLLLIIKDLQEIEKAYIFLKENSNRKELDKQLEKQPLQSKQPSWTKKPEILCEFNDAAKKIKENAPLVNSSPGKTKDQAEISLHPESEKTLRTIDDLFKILKDQGSAIDFDDPHNKDCNPRLKSILWTYANATNNSSVVKGYSPTEEDKEALTKLNNLQKPESVMSISNK